MKKGGGSINARRIRRRRRKFARIIKSLVVLILLCIGIVYARVPIGIMTKMIIETLAGNREMNEVVAVENVTHQYEDDKKLPQLEQTVTIMIDPGHGGHDPGTSTGNCDEKDIVLQIAKYLEKYLTNAGANVILTRDKDVFVDKYDRAAMANDNNVDLFISIHCNYLENVNISGIETYYLDGAADSMNLANIIHQNVLENTGASDMHVRTNDFVVIRETKMPAILIETGYLSNQKEARKLNNEDYQKKVAYGIGYGIVEFLENK